MTQGIACGAESAKNAQPGIEAAPADRSPHHSRAASGTPTRGIRNCNPLNIRKGRSKWRGERPDTPPAVGILPSHGEEDKAGEGASGRAAFVLVRNYITKYGCNSIEKIISRWAPVKDGNNTEKYIKDVCRMTGIGGRAPLAASDPRLKDIVWAMAQIESGKGILAYREAMERGWELAADTPKPPQRGGCREKGDGGRHPQAPSKRGM